jgi:hypothetical protein
MILRILNVPTHRLHEIMIIPESRIMIRIIIFNLSRPVKSMSLSTEKRQNK